MPQLIALALLGAGAVAGYRWFSRGQMVAARAAAERAEAELRRAARGHGRGAEPRDGAKGAGARHWRADSRRTWGLEWDASAGGSTATPGRLIARGLCL